MNKKEILVLSIVIFLSVIMWLIADIYHAMTKEIIKEKETFSNNFNYKINLKVLDLLEKKIE